MKGSNARGGCFQIPVGFRYSDEYRRIMPTKCLPICGMSVPSQDHGPNKGGIGKYLPLQKDIGIGERPRDDGRQRHPGMVRLNEDLPRISNYS